MITLLNMKIVDIKSKWCVRTKSVNNMGIVNAN